MDNSQPKNNVGKIALILGVIFFISVITSYIWKFHGTTISGDPGHWGVLGDFVGGIVNPLLGLVTIWLLTVSLQQNNDMLEQAREELRATLGELKMGQEIQKATENALKLQVLESQIARDFNNTIALYDNLEKKLARYYEKYPDLQGITGPSTVPKPTTHIQQKIFKDYEIAVRHKNELNHIIEIEHMRLLEKYPKPNPSQ